MKLVLPLVLLLLGLVAWNRYGPATELAVSAGFSFQTASRAAISEVVNATGVIKPRNGAEVRVGSRISGVLEKLWVDVGDVVESGQLLAELDTAEITGRLDILRARVRELEAQLAYSRLLLERNRGVSLLPETEIANLEKEVSIGEARLDQARAELENEALRLSWTRVSAPIAGTIASVSTQQGETIAASFAAPTFLTIIDLERLEIQAFVDEADIGRIDGHQQVRFSVDTWPGVNFEGRVRAVYPKAEIVNNVVNYIVIIDIEQQGGYLLRPEMTVHLQFVLREVPQALSVPRAALFADGDDYYLMLRGGDGWFRQTVQVGIVDAMRVEITAGLREGDVFVSDRQAWLAANPNGTGG